MRAGCICAVTSETDLRKVFHIEEIRALQMSVAIRFARPQLPGIDLRLDQESEEQRAWQSIVDETLAKLSGAWAERENLDEEMREIRRRWNRR